MPDWLSRFAFQPVSNLARSLSLALNCRCTLAFRDELRAYVLRSGSPGYF
jgi:hypothetical protein